MYRIDLFSEQEDDGGQSDSVLSYDYEVKTNQWNSKKFDKNKSVLEW